MTVTNTELQSQIARLDEKVDERHEANTRSLTAMGAKLDALIELHVGQKVQGQVITQLSEVTSKHTTDIEAAKGELVALKERVRSQGAAWKIVGAVLLASLAGIGWMVSQLKEYYQYEDKVDTLEFIVQGKPGSPTPGAQTSGAK